MNLAKRSFERARTGYLPGSSELGIGDESDDDARRTSAVVFQGVEALKCELGEEA